MIPADRNSSQGRDLGRVVDSGRQSLVSIRGWHRKAMGLGFRTDNKGWTPPSAWSYRSLDLPGREIRAIQQRRGNDANVGP